MSHQEEQAQQNYEEKVVLDDVQTIVYDTQDLEKTAVIDSTEMTPELVAAEKSLLRKLDYLYVMPCIAILNFLQFFDKSALNYAAVLGIKEDTHITTAEFGWLGSIFYLGYLVYQVPNVYLLQIFPIGKYVGGLIVVWGVILAVTCEAKNFSQLAALRFLLGFFEAGIYPCCIMLISTMYRRTEQSGRIGCVYICNGLALAVGGLIGYGIGHMANVGGKAAWQWIMIILGCVTVLFGCFCFFLLVDKPKSKFMRLTPEQQKVVDIRQLDNATVVTRAVNYGQILEALKEPRFYCFILASALINLQNGALNTFGAIITSGFGFSGLNSILLTVPNGVTDCIYIAFAIWYNRKYGNTIHLACVMMGISILGLVLLLVIPIAQVKLVGLYMCWSFAAAYVLFLTAIANNVIGYTKKIFYSSAVMVLYTIGNFAGPQMMSASAGPLYLGGMIGFIVADFLAIILLQIARYLMLKTNKERLANPSSEKFDPSLDLTDIQNTNFIYRL
ncbi:hypothetical protein A0J61_04751 [Choanephora cucurbitarum]|uniref:Major facilitator superfamily (MFS) profile domain-containing protein n=1 Tax=Choanephora cucurbitarum TaxID=101091 RepID=A0A1C7NE32_9FUNG|nr:hypothetical protein A0J61_04751 [Choanephora cucurbitarum]